MKKLKEILKKLIDEESQVKSMEVSGRSLEEALQNACAGLGITVKDCNNDEDH